MAAQDMNAIVRVKDKNGNVNTIYPATKIGNVEGLQTALNSKANASDVTSGLAGKVDKETGKVLSTNDYTTAEKNKLAGIAAGATANIGTVTQVKVGSTAYNPSSGVVSLPAYPTSLPASDVYSWAKASSKPSYTASEVGAIATTAKGAASGVAELDANGKVPSSQLPAYVDDVLEYTAKSSFPTTGETGKIYVDTTTNLTYRWSGSAYVEISPSLALGETSSTAYRGDRGKTAYNHSQVTSGNPHNVTKSDVGLGNVGNFKSVSTVASQGLSDTEKSNARANIGAGTSSFSGSYNDLSNKPTIPTKTSQLTNDSGYTKNTGTVTGVKVGSTSYSPSSGVVSLPAYPTTLPASDVSSWAKASSKPSYTYSEVGAAASSHAHGNIQNGGTLQTNDITIASGDKLVVTDSSDSSKIARASISFDGSTTSQALTKAGSWQPFNNYSHPTSAGNKHIPSGGSSGQILTYGGSSGTASWGNLPTIDTVLNGGSTNAVQNKVVTSAIVHTMDNGVKNLCPYSTFNMSGSGWTEIFSGYEEFPAGEYAIQVVYTSSATAQIGIVYTDGTSLNLTPVLSAATNTKVALGINATKPFKKIQIYHNAAITMNDVLFCKWEDFSISTAYNTPRVDPSVLIPLVYPSFKQPTKHSSITSIDSGGYIQIGKLVIVNMRFTVGSAISQYADLFTGLPAPLGNSAYVACASNTNTIMISSDGSMSNYAQGSLAAGMVVVSAVYMAQ